MASNIPSNLGGGIPVYIVGGGGQSVGYQQITALSAVTNLAPPAGATSATIVVSVAAVRYRDDGTPPTAAIGMPLPIGSTLSYGGNLAAVQFIQQAIGAVLDIIYYR